MAAKAPNWLRRAGCVFAIFGWLIVMATPCLAIALAMTGELRWQRQPYTVDRLWLVQAVEARGLGYSASRIVSDQRPAAGPVCVRTRVRFLMWRGSGEPADYCECYSPANQPLGACPGE